MRDEILIDRVIKRRRRVAIRARNVRENLIGRVRLRAVHIPVNFRDASVVQTRPRGMLLAKLRSAASA